MTSRRRVPALHAITASGRFSLHGYAVQKYSIRTGRATFKPIAEANEPTSYGDRLKSYAAALSPDNKVSPQNMQSANYTSENIARALGLTGFANDEELGPASKAIRVLLMPSFHAEVCITLISTPQSVTLSVVAAKEQIWHQVWPSPKLAETISAAGEVSNVDFVSHEELFRSASIARSESVVALDGMRAHAVLRMNRQCCLEVDENVARSSRYAEFVAAVVGASWRSVSDARVRNALGAAGSYVGLALPEEALPPAKPVIRTVVFGPADVSAQLLESLRRHHEG